MEVDLRATQTYKKQRLSEILDAIPPNASFVPMDFTKDNLLDELRKVGYSEQQITFFLWEGVTYYLPESAVKDTLHFVRDHSAAGSRIAFDYFGANNPAINNPLHVYARWGEPLLFGFANSRARNVGWRIDYVMVSSQLRNAVKRAEIHTKVLGSDHCPVSITLDDAP